MNIQKKADREIAEGCRRGDSTSFRDLFDEYKDRVYGTALKMLGNKQDAEDVSQEIFVKIFRTIQKFRGDSTLRTWIYKISVNSCLDAIRKKGQKDLTENIESMTNDPTLSYNDRQPESVETILERQISRLPAKCKTVFILYAIEGFKHEEIANIMSISTGTSKSQYFAAKAYLRKMLRPYKEIFTDGM
jgi:RNA polymerase sigma-70 factor (ECF subfamily)